MKIIIMLTLTLLLFFQGCKLTNYQSSQSEQQRSSSQQTASSPPDALYYLPFPVGKTYTCNQSFSGPYSHYGLFQYAVDFPMPVGTLVTCARAGIVAYIVQSNDDSTTGNNYANAVIVRHDNADFSRYCHIKKNGALVSVGQAVNSGDSIALSGSSGDAGYPHLHFDVTKYNPSPDVGQTIPFYFINSAETNGLLKQGKTYTALPYH